jgi:phosphatidate cytidylyltransferase
MTRLVSGVALAASAFALVWFLPSQALLAVALVVAGLAFVEYAKLARAVDAPLPFVPALISTLAACALVAWPAWPVVDAPLVFVQLAPALFGVSLLAVAVSLMTSGVHGVPVVHGAAAGMLAPVYIGLPLGTLVVIHQMAGREGVLTLIATVAASDSSQYYAGRLFGRRPLAPIISPKKTIEGAIGGFVLAPLVLVVIARWSLPALHPGGVWAAGLGIVAAGIAGDLFKSTFKRAAGVKDSGSLIPGHGGVLDRIDALLFCAPLFYLLLTLA